MKEKELKEYMRNIAKLYGCKVSFRDISGGFFDGKGRITVGTKCSERGIVSSFCHELAHHCNQIDGKFSRYHNGDGWLDRSNIIKSCNYAYRAERYTDLRGREICRTWFPYVRYEMAYDNSPHSKGFLLGYFTAE